MSDVSTTEEVRARMVESIAGGTISVPGGYGDLARDDAENIVDAILGELAAHDAEVAARTATILSQLFPDTEGDVGVKPAAVRKWLGFRAAEYRKAVQS